MTTRQVMTRILVSSLYLIAVHAVLGMLITSPGAPPENAGPWFLLSTLLVTTTLCVLASRSDWRGMRLAAALAAIPGVVMLTNYIEGMFFLTDVEIDWARESLRVGLVAILMLPLWALLFRESGVSRRDIGVAAGTVKERPWRFVLADLVFVALYFTAGVIVFPFVRDFYTTQTIPPTGTVVTLQLLLRGPIFVGVCVVMTRLLALPRSSGSVVVGAAFATLNGIAPLIIPSSVFPDAVRWAHLIEVTISSFIFGALVGWLWGRPNRAPQLATKAA